ncbi:hypothetical protein tb265_44110 [Gemmatimonadetes bacterium T265]|nr:hypothetical protein tb265_44110 [Gemmatimonadetes bacterium T265]
MPSRRDFLQRSAAHAVAGLTIGVGDGRAGARRSDAPPPESFVDVRRPPDLVAVQTAAGVDPLARVGDGTGDLASGGWQRGAARDHVRVATQPVAGALRVALAAPGTPVLRLRLRWRGPLDAVRLVLGDALERGYGDLEWRGMVPDRPMPWYAATWDGRRTHAYGVRTRPAAFCFWQVDPLGVTLWADVRSGGAGLTLGERTLAVCDVVARPGQDGESAFAALHAFCREMSPAPRLPARPVYGSNDWYWAYGRNSASSVAADAERVVALAPPGENRPFAVIDDGWQPERGEGAAGKGAAGMWDRGNEKFGDMAAVAASVRRAGARPGIWYRPLVAPADAPASWRLPRQASVLDPSVPAVLERVTADVARLRGWGYELIKHDFTTYDVLGRWGFAMGPELTAGEWTFAAGPTRTTAEVLDALYAAIRRGADAAPDDVRAGGALVLGCNTVSHLSAGHFELSRAGDDTSGREWARTRKMGVNTLAFRGTQHGAFYAVDADCVGVTTAIPWAHNRQWLDLVARSGTPLFVSLAPDALGAEQRRDLRAALALAARPQPLGEPLDWQATTIPARWRLLGEERRYTWMDDEGAPLSV